MLSDKNLGEVLSEIILERGITLDKLSELTNIPKRYLIAMMDNDFKNMPAHHMQEDILQKSALFLKLTQGRLLMLIIKLDLKLLVKTIFFLKIVLL